MSSAVTWTERNPQWVSLALWAVSAMLALPLASGLVPLRAEGAIEGTVETGRGEVAYSLPRSELVGREVVVLLKGPVPSGTGGSVRYRVVGEPTWKTTAMTPQTFEARDGGSVRRIDGVGARLPALDERAAAYEYLVVVTDGVTKPLSITKDVAVRARYRAPIPWPLGTLQTLLAFAVGLLAIRAALEAVLPDGDWEWLAWSEVIAVAVSVLVVAPVIGWRSLASVWSAVPLSWGWTENRVLLLLAAWAIAAVLSHQTHRGRVAVLLAALATVTVALLPGA